MNNRAIFLCGFMGAGKSTVGLKLAGLLARTFLDLDTLIETRAGAKISEIFATSGEAYFRELERQEVDRLTKGFDGVVALGGGTLSNEDCLQTIKEKGTLIYLAAEPETIQARLAHADAKAVRPLLASLSALERRLKISELMRERMPFYLQADIHIATDLATPETLAGEIEQLITRSKIK
jgi:shikimate kinase